MSIAEEGSFSRPGKEPGSSTERPAEEHSSLSRSPHPGEGPAGHEHPCHGGEAPGGLGRPGGRRPSPGRPPARPSSPSSSNFKASGKLGSSSTWSASASWSGPVLRRLLLAFCLAVVACVALLLLAGKALGATPAPAFTVHSFAYPANFSESGNTQCLAHFEDRIALCDGYQITIPNTGALRTDGTAITIKDTLPAGLEAKSVRLFVLAPEVGSVDRSSTCTLVPLSCKFRGEEVEGVKRPGILKPDEALEMQVFVTVKAGTTGPLVNTASVSGGGAPAASGSSTNQISAEAAPFAANLSTYIAGLDGAPETQAGGHPYEFTTRFEQNSEIRPSPESQLITTSTEDLKDAVVNLPLGFIGSATAAPTCKFSQLVSAAGCPADSVVGHIYTEPEALASVNSAIYNMLPERGHAAEFGFADVLNNTHAIYASVVPTSEGYVLRATTPDIPQVALTDAVATFFGDPAAKDESSATPVAMFTNPSSCTGQPLLTSSQADSWQRPGRLTPEGSPDPTDPDWQTSSSQSPAVTGCEALAGLFQPTISASATNTQADSPTGLDVDIKVPQEQNPETLAVPPLRKAVVALPAGMTVNASSVNGLEACSLAQIGISAAGQPNAAAPSCPEASKIGSVELETPALPAEACKEAKSLAECPDADEREKTPLKGSIFVAKQSENPFHSLLAIYIVIDDPRTGVLVKLAGEVKADSSNGQLTAVVDNSPQFPFSELRTHFFAGATASLATPAACGSYTATSELTPWSAPQSGPAATPSGSFQITQGAGGGSCSSAFAPAFQAGAQSTQAGGFTPFSVSFSRSDADQQLGGISVTTPPGLLGVLKSVVRCPEPQAAQADCGPESLIGESSVAVGTGPAPYWVKGGQVYLTGPYDKGPFGLSIVTPTTAGPYTLTGNGGPGREIVRASIRIDPATSQITVLSDPLPTILEGIPLQIRTVEVTIDRPGFMFNPTSCNPLSVTAAISSTQGATAPGQSPFQATNCKALAFKPIFAASTQAKTSKANGASLKVKIAYPSTGPAEANVARVDLEIPKILPTRLTTIQKACTEAQFNANPAGCPAASAIATASVQTPLLANPLTGPAYFVSHGNAAFPDVEIVLQGEGIELIVDGKTQIKNGVTFSHFETVPDAPFSSFEFNAPQGPFSIFGANGDLCGAPVKLPVKMSAQNGATFSQSTNVEVQGCASSIKIASKKIRKRTITLKVTLPAAGKLTATGKGLSKVSKTAKGRATVTLTLKAKGTKKLKSKVKLSFVPAAKGQKKLTASLGVRVSRG
jgi:hypothetical protein